MINFIKSNKYYIIFFFSVAVIAAFFPPSADDLAWATSQGLSLLKKGFENYNGRYLGNILAVILTRIPVILPLIKAFVLTAILFYIQKLSSKQSDLSVILCGILLIIPSPLFIQAFVWTAGFTNYVVSALLLLVSADLLINRKSSALNCAILFILGISCQLFMETYTLFVLVFGLVYLVYASIKKEGILKGLVFFAGSVIGAIIMFSNGVYTKIAAGDDIYQKITTGSNGFADKLLNMVTSLFKTVSLEAIKAAFPALAVITVICIILILKSKKATVSYWISLSLMIASGAMYPVLRFLLKLPDAASYCFGFLLIFFFISVTAAVIACAHKSTSKKMLILFGMLLIMTVPLCMVFPVGPRCFAGAYIILLIAANEILKEITFNKEVPKKLLPFKAAFALAFVIGTVCYSTVFFSNISKINSIRSQAAQGSKTITIEHTKLSFFVYAIDTENTSPKFMQRFCEYYALPYDIEIIYK